MQERDEDLINFVLGAGRDNVEMKTDEKIILDFIKQLCLDQDNYLNTEFGVDRAKLYIDGCLEYPDEKTKKIIKNWLKID